MLVIVLVVLLGQIGRGRHSWLAVAAASGVFAMAHVTRFAALPLICVAGLVAVFKRSWLYAPLLLLCIAFIAVYSVCVSSEQRERFGETTKGFSGWQMANCAIAVRPHCRNIELDGELAAVDTYVTGFPPKTALGYGAMWGEDLCLKRYLANYLETTEVEHYVGWQRVSNPFFRYGVRVVSRNPLVYLRRFVLPNTLKLFWPKRSIVTEGYDYASLQVNEKFGEQRAANRVDIVARTGWLWNVFSAGLIVAFLITLLRTRRIDELSLSVLVMGVFLLGVMPVNLRVLVPLWPMALCYVVRGRSGAAVAVVEEVAA